MEKALKEAIVDIHNCVISIGGFAQRLSEKKLKKTQYQDYARRIIEGVKQSELVLGRLDEGIIFLGQWDTTLDEGWRLTLPREVAKKFNRRLLLKEGKNCLEIHRSEIGVSEMTAPFASFQPIKIQKMKKAGHDNGSKRVTIPPFLRQSDSFACGTTVTLASRGGYLEIWPRYEG